MINGALVVVAGLLMLSGCAKHEIGTIEFAAMSDADPQDDLNMQRGSHYWAAESETDEFRGFVKERFPDRVATFVLAVDLEPINRWFAIATMHDPIDAPPDGCLLVADALNQFYRKRQYSDYDRMMTFLHQKAQEADDPRVRNKIEQRISDVFPREDIAGLSIATASSPK